jgi:hypothetical protein
MPERRTVYKDADGVRRTLITDDERPGFVVQTEQVLDQILDGIARDRELVRPGADIKPAARIPIELYERMILEGWDEDDFRKWLNSPAAEPFRIWRGRV